MQIQEQIYTNQERDEIPAADFKSYEGTVNADCVPSKTVDTVDDITEANIIIAVVNGGEFSARRGLNTVSMAKKQPATAALKPERKLEEEYLPLQRSKLERGNVLEAQIITPNYVNR